VGRVRGHRAYRKSNGHCGVFKGRLQATDLDQTPGTKREPSVSIGDTKEAFQTMPTKRRFILFFIVLAVMLLVKYAASQEAQANQPVGWRGPDAADSAAIEHAVYVTMAGGVVFGIVAGGGRALAHRRRIKRDGYFTGDLTMMSLREDSTTSPESEK